MIDWKPGMRAEIFGCTPGNWAEVNGEIIIVDSTPAPGPEGDMMVCFLPTIKKDGRVYDMIKTIRIRPIPDDYDGNEATNWNECPWQPAEVMHAD